MCIDSNLRYGNHRNQEIVPVTSAPTTVTSIGAAPAEAHASRPDEKSEEENDEQAEELLRRQTRLRLAISGDMWSYEADISPICLEMKHSKHPTVHSAIRRAKLFILEEVPWLTDETRVVLADEMEKAFTSKSSDWGAGAIAEVTVDAHDTSVSVVVCTQKRNCTCGTSEIAQA